MINLLFFLCCIWLLKFQTSIGSFLKVPSFSIKTGNFFNQALLSINSYMYLYPRQGTQRLQTISGSNYLNFCLSWEACGTSRQMGTLFSLLVKLFLSLSSSCSTDSSFSAWADVFFSLKSFRTKVFASSFRTSRRTWLVHSRDLVLFIHLLFFSWIGSLFTAFAKVNFSHHCKTYPAKETSKSSLKRFPMLSGAIYCC